jgi:hypothetical protein
MKGTDMRIMLSDMQQDDVWEGWIGAEVRSYYFAEMCGRYHQVQRLITWAILAASSGAAAAILSGLPNWMRLFLALATAGLSLWSVVANNNETATDCSDVHFRWSKLAIDYKALWGDMYSQDAATRLSDLLQRDAELSKTCNVLPNRPEDLRRWERFVVDRHRAPAII